LARLDGPSFEYSGLRPAVSSDHDRPAIDSFRLLEPNHRRRTRRDRCGPKAPAAALLDLGYPYLRSDRRGVPDAHIIVAPHRSGQTGDRRRLLTSTRRLQSTPTALTTARCGREGSGSYRLECRGARVPPTSAHQRFE